MIKRAIVFGMLVSTLAHAQVAPDAGVVDDGGLSAEQVAEITLRDEYAKIADAGVVFVAGAFACEPVGFDPCGRVSDNRLGRGWWMSEERLDRVAATVHECNEGLAMCSFALEEERKKQATKPPSIDGSTLLGALCVGIAIGIGVTFGGTVVFEKIRGEKK